MSIIGYARVSTTDQDTRVQVEALERAGVGRLFQERLSAVGRRPQLDRMLELGVEPSFFVLHTYYWGDRHRDIFLGPDRARRISPARSALERGLRFTLHTDSPVTPMDPWLLIWSAVNRRTTSGEALGPEQRLTPLQALRATTIDSAGQLGVGADRGSLEPGKLADFAVLDRDPLQIERDALRDVRVLSTYVGGKRVAR